MNTGDVLCEDPPVRNGELPVGPGIIRENHQVLHGLGGLAGFRQGLNREIAPEIAQYLIAVRGGCHGFSPPSFSRWSSASFIIFWIGRSLLPAFHHLFPDECRVL